MRKSILLLVIFFASACSVKTLYNQLDWLIADHLQSYVELDNEQRYRLNQHLKQTMLWHKSSQLPLYVKWLADFKADITGAPTVARLEQDLAQLQTFLRSLRAHAADELAVLLPGLSAAQRRELYAGMEKKNVEFADKFIRISREQQLEQYIERMRDRFDEWLGSITAEQAALIKASAVDIKPVASEVLKTRRRWRGEFIRILEEQAETGTTKHAIHELFVNVDRLRSEAYQRAVQHNQQVFTKLICAVAKSMNKGQHEYFSDKVSKYSRYFIELAEEARLDMNK